MWKRYTFPLVAAFFELGCNDCLSGSGLCYNDTPQAIPLDQPPRVMEFGDLTGDQRTDVILLLERFPAPTRVQILNGVDFSVIQELSLATNTFAVTLGDIDQDSDLDLIAGDDTGFEILLNQGDGTLSQAAFVAKADFTTIDPEDFFIFENVALSDEDGDGDLDIVSGAFIGSQVEIFSLPNDGLGVFGEPLLLPGGRTCALANEACGDLDGDGDLDRIDDGFNLDIELNQGDDSLVVADSLFPFDGVEAFFEDFFISTELGDLDGDGDLDIVSNATLFEGGGGVILNTNTHVFSAVVVLLNQGNAVFSEEILLAETEPHTFRDETISSTVADLDQDGVSEIILKSGEERALRVVSFRSGAAEDEARFLLGKDFRETQILTSQPTAEGPLDIVLIDEAGLLLFSPVL